MESGSIELQFIPSILLINESRVFDVLIKVTFENCIGVKG